MKNKTGFTQLKRNLRGIRVVVVGMARTGIAAAEFLSHMGARVTVSESRSTDDLGPAPARLEKLGVSVEVGGHSPDTFAGADLIVLSPGVDPLMPALTSARAKDVPMISEIEFASWYIQAPIIAITGTNGKSTTTALVGHILASADHTVFVGGNIGTPLTNYLLYGNTAEFIVAEVSSFQLETIHDFRPHIAVLINLQEDHLERHHTFTSYVAAKTRLFDNQTENDWAVLNQDDPTVSDLATRLKARVIPFGRTERRTEGIWLQNSSLLVNDPRGGTGHISLEHRRIIGPHNLENIMAAVGAVIPCGVPLSVIEQAVASFSGLEHRLEPVGTWRGTSVYNDSKATNVSSTLTALMSFNQPLVLLAGGKDKGNDFKILREAIREKVAALILMGAARQRMWDALHDVVPTYLAEDMEDAVRLAWEASLPGYVILLSPACASFDMFTDYVARGDVFKQLVRDAAGEVHG